MTPQPVRKGLIVGLLVFSPMLWSPGAVAGKDSKPLTRGEAVSVLLSIRTPTLPTVENKGQFTDVRKGQANERALLAAERFGIIQADATKNLRPDAPVTRAAFLKMLTLTFGLTTRIPYAFKDVSSTAWYSPYAGIAARYAIFSRTDGTELLRPDSVLSKGEASDILQSMIASDIIRPTSSLDRTVAYEQSTYKLQIYDKISTVNDVLTRLPVNPPSVPSASAQSPMRLSIVSVKEKVVSLINDERLKRNMAPLHNDSILSQSAQKYAQEILSEGFFSHVSPQGETLKDRMVEFGYYNPANQQQCFCIQKFVVGENLARGQKTADEVVKDWMKSPTHRSVLLNPEFTDTGVGVAAGIWVQHFGGVRFTDEQ